MAKNSGRIRNRFGLAAILIVVMLICGFIFFKTREIKEEANALNQEEAGIRAQIEEETRKKNDLENEIKYRQTNDYIEDQAREIFGLRDPDETILKPASANELKQKQVSNENENRSENDTEEQKVGEDD